MILKDISNFFFLEIILEPIPISSSGNITLLSHFYKDIKPLCFFEAHLSHLFIFFTQFFLVTPLLWHLFDKQKYIQIIKLIKDMILITSTTVILYFFKKIVFLKISYTLPLFIGFAITTVLLFIIQIIQENKKNISIHISCKNSIIIGAMQSLSFIPGVSRFATVLTTFLLLGYSRKNAFFFAILTNISIGSLSFIYVIYYHILINPITCILTKNSIFLLIGSTIIGIFFSYIVSLLYKKKKIWLICVYEFIITIITFIYCNDI